MDGQDDVINPTRAEQLDILISMLNDFTTPSDCILDLGYGSGKVEELLLEHIPGGRPRRRHRQFGRDGRLGCGTFAAIWGPLYRDSRRFGAHPLPVAAGRWVPAVG